MNERPLPISATLYDVVRSIEVSRRRIAVVVAEDGKLLGTLTDGDVRRCLLAGGTLETLATQAMNLEPVIAQMDSPEGYMLDLMKRANVLSLPVVDSNGRFERLVHLTDLNASEEQNQARGFAAAVIMAGGEGIRLRPLTHTIPKPMVQIGGIPLLERQVCRLAAAGVKRCFISVNYLSHIIEDHFGDGARLGIAIEYLYEKDKMGTAGALSLLPDAPDGPLLVMNGDIFTTSDFGSLYNYHTNNFAFVTVAAVDYRVQIPYGVIRAEGHRVSALEEKPSQRFLCNAGIYAVAPEAIAMIPSGFYNMTDLIRDCLSTGRSVSVFPVHEYWSDIGTPDDLEKARAAFTNMTRQHD